MDSPRRPSPLHLLLALALAWELSATPGRATPDCPEVVGRLGAGVVLPLSQEGARSSRNASVRVLVTAANSSDTKERRKLVSVHLPEEQHLPLGHRYRLQQEPRGLEIPQSRREDELWYYVSLEWNFTVEQFCRHLRLYEQVSALEIRVLNHTQDAGSGNCSVTLACQAERGDSVTYSWSLDTGRGPPLGTASSSQLLHLVLGPQGTDHLYVCTASNPVSTQVQTFQPGPLCGRPPGPRRWSPYMALLLLVPLAAVPVLVALLARRGKAELSQPAEKAASLTIYAQVQRAGSLHRTGASPEPQEDPCTTIYVAASAPASESAQPTPGPAHCPRVPSYITVTAES
ncbi:signaling lymphocytic activation molecule [Sorex araneus]|uniref:signaling lymphocytic activation molecule n=1 Tax=Sorex araneus TaxID=42254 RepID=UPI002433AEEB|nr:signaling lymphocytic activation molecule [Sorex araneus]